MLLPGPEAQQLATYNGWLLHGIRGGIVAGALFVIPSIFVLLANFLCLRKVRRDRGNIGDFGWHQSRRRRDRCRSCYQNRQKSVQNKLAYCHRRFGFCCNLFSARIPFPLIIFGAGISGIYWVAKSKVSNAGPKRMIAKPEYISFSKILYKCFRSVSGFGLFRLLRCLLFTLGWKSLQMKAYFFFTQAAFVTFGGAYAVLAYVNQIAVDSYDWLSAQQAIDGFGLAETTPGPLIMVLQFVGFMAGWNNPAILSQGSSAVLTALLTTFATFLPCFFFIFAFAPIIEKFQDNQKLKAILSGVTAAVVGVILNLALVFGFAVIYHDESFNLFALFIGVVSFAILLRFKIDVLWIVLGGGILGFVKLLFIS